MRKQYHSRRVGNRNFIWDVHRLVELGKDLPIEKVKLSTIAELDESFWFDANTQPTCRAVALHAKLIADVDLSHPILLSADGRVMDGMHRVCRALMDGREDLSAKRFARDPDADYVGVELEALPYD